jgi:acyl carrier protein
MWQFVDLGEAGRRIRGHPEISEVAGVRAPDGRLYVLVEQQGLMYGPVLRDIVLDEVEAEQPDIAVAVVPSLPRVDTDGAVDTAASVAVAQQAVEDGRWVFRLDLPETEEEKAVAALVLEILGVRRVSMTDSLPLLGADSLVLVELSAAMSQRFGVTVNAMDMFDVDNVRELAQLAFGPHSATPA